MLEKGEGWSITGPMTYAREANQFTPPDWPSIIEVFDDHFTVNIPDGRGRKWVRAVPISKIIVIDFCGWRDEHF